MNQVSSKAPGNKIHTSSRGLVKAVAIHLKFTYGLPRCFAARNDIAENSFACVLGLCDNKNMADKITNELIYKVLTDVRGDTANFRKEIEDFRKEMREFRSDISDRLDSIREHIGAQQMDITHIYRKLDFLTEELERLKTNIPDRPSTAH